MLLFIWWGKSINWFELFCGEGRGKSILIFFKLVFVLFLLILLLLLFIIFELFGVFGLLLYSFKNLFESLWGIGILCKILLILLLLLMLTLIFKLMLISFLLKSNIFLFEFE